MCMHCCPRATALMHCTASLCLPGCRFPEEGSELGLDMRTLMPWRRQYAILLQ